MSLNELIKRLYVSYDRPALLEYFRDAGSVRPDLEVDERSTSMLLLCNNIRSMGAVTAVKSLTALIGSPIYVADLLPTPRRQISSVSMPEDPFESLGALSALETKASLQELVYLFS